VPHSSLLVAPAPLLLVLPVPDSATALSSVLDEALAAQDRRNWRAGRAIDEEPGLTLAEVGTAAVRAGKAVWVLPVMVDSALVLCAVSTGVAERAAAVARRAVGAPPVDDRPTVRPASVVALEHLSVATALSGDGIGAGPGAISGADRLVVPACGLAGIRHAAISLPRSARGRRASVRAFRPGASARAAGIASLVGAMPVLGWTPGNPASGEPPALCVAEGSDGRAAMGSLCAVELSGTKPPVRVEGPYGGRIGGAAARATVKAAAARDSVLLLAPAEASMALVRELSRRAWM